MKSASLLCLVMALAACSTPSSRMRDNPAAVAHLRPADRQLALQGRIRPGMSKEAVYIAWDRPDEIQRGYAHRRPSETWIYLATATDDYPNFSYFPYGFGHRFFFHEVYHPILITRRYVERMVTFENGVVVAWMG
ncbi:MAG: hypothetical protein M3O82_00270, partial [Verrucomicrobiota bacterium]|nr:hypothetical protein [Verrucomicrobiota bacterium]